MRELVSEKQPLVNGGLRVKNAFEWLLHNAGKSLLKCANGLSQKPVKLSGKAGD